METDLLPVKQNRAYKAEDRKLISAAQTVIWVDFITCRYNFKKEISPTPFPDQQGGSFKCKWLKIFTNGGISKESGGCVHFKGDQNQWLEAVWIFCLDINWNLLCRKPHLENTVNHMEWQQKEAGYRERTCPAWYWCCMFILSQKANTRNPLQNKKSPHPHPTFSLYTGRASYCF